ncbi:PAS domain S-box protein [Devosia sp. XJ19-1]|uniref:histidine kinase n=1 Tax=Devosia ureilytica TaxID=2952754 RepID=A0A9Q4FRG5_9HYPH|nr:PAS domain S-box protein [Devosia ureilytica]MCP8882325.1 PAS domain S-box protein [Devosia ureilytica]MCP8885789.1 PAS domain S-box protein [Devosia ureilytica]
MSATIQDLNGFIDLIDDSVLVSSPGEIITGWNQGARELYGWTAAEAIGQTIPDLLQCETAQPRGEILDIVRDQGFWTGEAQRRSREGNDLLISLTWRARRAGETIELYETSRNMARHKELEIRLDRAQHLASSLFQSGTAAFWRLDFTRVLPMIHAIRAGGVKDLSSYLANNPAVISEMMKVTAVIDANDRAVEWHGSEKSRLLNGQLSQLWPQDARRFFADCVIGLVDGNQEAAAEVMLRAKDGRTFDALFTAHFAPHAAVDGTLVVAVSEITDRTRAHQAVARSDYRYRRLFPALAAAYWELDMRAMNERLALLRDKGVDDLVHHAARDPNFVEDALQLITVSDVNERTVDMMGVASRKDLIGLPVSRFWPDKSKAAFLGALNAGFQGFDWSDRETRLRTPDGREVDVLFSAASPPHMREIGIAVLSVTDITERRQAERRLAESEYRSRKLFEAMALGIWELDFRDMKAYVYNLVQQGLLRDLFSYWRDNPDFVTTMMSKVKVVEVNQKTLDLFGAESQEAIRVDLGRFWPPESHHLFLKAVQHTSVLKHDKFEAETRVRRLDGTVFDALFTSWEMPEITDPNHVLVGIVDISEKVAARAELARVRDEMAHASRVSMLGELTASIAHELNQPLAAITTLGEANRRYLDRNGVDLDKVRELNGRIIADTQRAAGIIGRIRQMAMPASPTHSVVQIEEVVKDSVTFLEHEVLSKNASLHMSVAADLAPVMGDAIQLQQVIVNLVVNAVQAMAATDKPERRISVSARPGDGRDIEILVADNGPGIPPATAEHIFDSFFTTKPTGMGIGLPICRTIVESFGGTIDLVPTEIGACFRVRLPVAS